MNEEREKKKLKERGKKARESVPEGESDGSIQE